MVMSLVTVGVTAAASYEGDFFQQRRPHRRLDVSRSMTGRGEPITNMAAAAGTVVVSSLHQLFSLVLLGTTFISYTEACSRRSTPKARPTPHIPSLNNSNSDASHQDCPEPYNEEFCLHGGSCFAIQIGDGPASINCQCTAGWTGRRCELKDLPDDYFVRGRTSTLKQAGLATSVSVLVVLVVIITAILVHCWRRKQKREKEAEEEDTRDGRAVESTERQSIQYTCIRDDLANGTVRLKQPASKHLPPNPSQSKKLPSKKKTSPHRTTQETDEVETSPSKNAI